MKPSTLLPGAVPVLCGRRVWRHPISGLSTLGATLIRFPRTGIYALDCFGTLVSVPQGWAKALAEVV